jgi:apolipoprotein D and lipocalin family protein
MRVVALLPVLAVLACVHAPPEAPPEVVADVDLARYAGRWFDVGHFPAPFQDECACSTAEYTPISTTKVKVENRCIKRGKVDTVEGTARVKDPAVPAVLGVKFFPIFEAPYWIVDLDPDYQWAVVASPDRKYLWILSRSPELDPAVRAALIADLQQRGFDMSRLEPSPQLASCPVRSL